jgi:hypothetical protein
MRCPKCGELASEGAAICQNCNEILDASFLEGLSEPDEEVVGDRTDVGPPPTHARPGNVRPLRPSLARPTALKPSASRANWGPNKAPPAVDDPPPAPAVVRGRPEPMRIVKPPDPLGEAKASVDDLKALFVTLSMPDRWAAGAAILLLLTLILPWRWTKLDEEVIGLVEAWPALFFASGALAALYARAKDSLPQQRAALQLGQLGCGLLGALYAAQCVRTFSDGTVVQLGGRTVQLVSSAPRFGLYLGAIFAGALLLASVASAFERK